MNATPYPVQLGGISISDLDRAFEIDATNNMTMRQTVINGVALADISRIDNAPIGDTDLTITNINLVAGGLKCTFTATGNGNTGIYLIKFRLTLADTSVLVRSFLLPVSSAVG